MSTPNINNIIIRLKIFKTPKPVCRVQHVLLTLAKYCVVLQEQPIHTKDGPKFCYIFEQHSNVSCVVTNKSCCDSKDKIFQEPAKMHAQN